MKPLLVDVAQAFRPPLPCGTNVKKLIYWRASVTFTEFQYDGAGDG